MELGVDRQTSVQSVSDWQCCCNCLGALIPDLAVALTAAWGPFENIIPHKIVLAQFLSIYILKRMI